MGSTGSTTWYDLGISVIQLTDRIIPSEISFGKAYPNPFNPVTMVSFGVPSSMNVEVVVHDMLGRVVGELANDMYNEGTYELQWDASDQSSGIYFIKRVAGDQVNIQKLMLVK